MKIVVCVKQVPEVTNVQVDPVTGTLIREGVKSILNPFCEYALDHAVRIAAANVDVEIIAITMGPPQARDVLLRSMELGANRGILVTDRKFAGADTWATAYTLATAIRTAVPDFDLILVGKQAIDGDTAQVGPEIAEILALPQITYGVEASLNSNRRQIRVSREVERGYEVIEANLPALVTFSKGEVVRRVPSLKDVVDSRRKPIRVVNASELDIPEDQLGLKGSFTQVVKVFPPQEKKSGMMVQNVEAEQAALEIFTFLKKSRFI
ncbi:MAG: electron transfer flavoprotein subunit beta/FixA family protein [Anaerolineaceae bacterium]|nr:electron transfer flavoprotein subunit beta/FixA family protein [Anaerolineaceae bacterium]